MHEAARNGDMKRLKALIAEGGDVNAQSDHWGGTPMHLAAASGRRPVIEFLISKGANVNAQNRYGRTPLDDAVDREQQDIAELLRTAGAKAGTRLSEKSRTSRSFFESATGRFTIPSKRLEIPDDMQACVTNLQRIYAALKRYEKDKGDLPHWLSDLVPDYLDQNMLLCPDHPEHRAVFRYFEPQTSMQPGLPCSYGYQFSMSRLPSNSPGSITGRMITRDRKIAQMKLFGDVVPLVRCRAHRVILNLAVNGQVYVSPMVWEKIFIRDYRGGQEFEEPSP
jgi:hypothetical protein